LNELPELYFARKTGLESPKTSGSVSYADFVQRESEQVTSLKGRESLNYWEKELKINTPDLPVLNLPFDYPQPRMQSYNGETFAFTLNVDVIEDTRNLAEKDNILLSDFFLAAFQTFLYRYTRQSIILTGIATDTRMAEFARMVGNFTNFVGLRSDFSDKPGFREFLRQVRESRLRSSDHQTYPFPSLVKKVTQVRDHLTWSPIFQVLFAWQNGITSEESRQDKDQSIFVWKLDEIIHYEGQFDLVLDIIEENKSLKCAFRYNSDLFKMETIERMARHFQTLLQGIVKNPDQSIGSLPLLTDGEKQKFLVELNQTTLEIPPKCVHVLFQDQVRKTPDAVALVFCTGQSEKTKELTYSELSIKTNALAYYLKAEGVKEETIVGLCMERSLDMIVGLIAILKAGGAYMPMDPAYPDHRLRAMLEDSKPTLVLTHHQTSDRVRTVLIKEKNVDIDDIEIDNKEQPDISEVRFWPDSLASIIYTSGSTGKPKGVMITHRNLCNTILRANYQFGLIPGTRVAQFASLNFVMAAGDIFSSICSGATLYMGTKEALIPGDPLTNFLDKHQIDVICMPSSSLALLSHEKVKVKNILVAAEPCPSEIMKKWAKNRNFFIGYGLTEATGGATSKKCSTTDTIPLIGRPNPNTLAYILDEDLQPLPVGVAGELYIGGEGITRGYLNNRQLTEEKFIPNPFSDVPGSMLCRTGDMVKYLPDGDIAFLYRCDFQINIRGFRIESGEIEVTLDRHPEIKQSVVIARKDNSGHQRLIAYFVPASNKPLNVDDLRDFIGNSLPEYMVPGIFVKLDKLPMTPNGKIDRMALPEPTQNQMVQPHTDYTPPENVIEKRIAEICKKILLTETPGINDNFFEMGADSLLLVRICDELQKVFQCQLPVIKLFEFPTIRSLGKYMHSEFNLQQDSISIKNAHMSHQLPGESRIIVLSALNQERLKVYAGNIANFLSAANDHKRSVTLDSVAYTLQIGRKAMNERLAFVVSDLETVAIKLKDYSEGKKTIDGLYTGNAKNEPSDPGLSILQGREGAEFIRIIIEDRKLDRLAQLWVSGSDIDWRLIYPEKTPNRILLPTYPFEKIRHCIEPESQADDRNRINKLTQGNIFPASMPLYYQAIWEKEALTLESLADGFKGHLLIFDTQNIDLAESLRKKGLINESQLTVVKEGTDYHISEQGHYVINPKNQSDYQNLVQSLFNKKGLFPENIIHFWSHNEFEADPDALRLQLDHGFYSLFYLTRTLMALKQNHGIKTLTKILYVFKNGSNTPQPQYAALSGFSKSLMIEDASFFCKTIGVDAHLTEPIDQLAEIIIREFSAYTNKGMVIQYANGERFSKKLLEFDHDKASINDLPLKKQGVYMITGGMGGLGLIFGEYLASEYKASLILTGRSDLTPEKHEQLRKLKSSGAEVLYLKADVAKPEDMERVFNESKTKFKGINGIIHSAGVIRRGFIRETTQQDIDQVLIPKVEGTIYLDQYFKDEPLDFFVLFSSISSEIESLGLPAYSVANAFLDNFAELREGLRSDKKRFGKTLFINWPLWKHGGMQPGRQTEKILSQTLGMTLLKTETGLNAFTRGLTFSQTGFMVIEGDPTKIRHALQQQKYPAQENLISDMMENPTEEDRTLLLNKIINDLTDIASRLLKIKKKDIGQNKSLNDYGFDSLSLTEFAGEINEKYQFSSEPITPPVFFEFTTISAMSAHLLNTFTFDMVRFYRQFAPSVSDREININESVLDKSSGHEVLPLMGPSVCLSKGSKSVSDTCDIAIIGISGVFPQSEDIHTFWQHLENGDNLVTEIPKDRWDWKAYDGDPYTEVNKTNVRWGGFMKQVDRFDPMFFNISPREACLMDPQQRIFLETAWKCIEDAGYKPSDLSGTKTGLFVGISNSGFRELISQQNVPIESHMATGTAASIIANRISYLLNLHGPSEPVDTACSSSLVAIHQAVRSIQNNDCELAIAGGVNIILMPTGHIYLAQSGMLSPDGKCKTFDKDANGFVRGEGTSAVFLKPLERAIADRDYLYGIIKGTAVNHGGRANFLTAPNTAAQADLLITAYDRAGIDPSTIGYIETHGTGTELGDPVEVDALKKAFSELYKRWNRPVSNIPHCGIGSVKTNIGHLEAASGMAGLVKTILAINHGKLPCTLHFKEVNPYIQLKNTPFYIVDKQCPWKRLTDDNGMTLPRRAGVSSFGFGGTNAHIIIEEYMNKRMLSHSKASQFEPYIIVLSAKNNETLMIYAKNLTEYLNTAIKNEKLPDLINIAYTLQVGREAMQERLAVLVSTIEELIEKLTVYTHHGKNNCEGLYVGRIGKDQNKENLALMTDGAEGKRFVEEILQNRKMDTLAQVWVSGAHVDWERLYPENAACRVPLPSYPFEKRRYWIPDGDKTGKKETLVHVLKNHDVLDDLKSAVPMTGLISTLNRTGVMLEDLTDLSRSFALYAGGCGDEVLDIGCAYGVATIAALEQGANVLAVDMEQHHLDILSERITEETKQCLSIKQGLLPDIDFEDERFGAIHASRVIHFLSPNDIQKTIKKMFRWLKPGGKLFLITDTPYVGYWQSKFLTYEERKAEGDLWPGYIKDVATVFDSKEVDGAPSLINPLDPDTLCREVMAAGFSVEKAEFIKNPSMSGSVKPGKEHAGVIAVKPIRFIRSVKPDVKPSVKLSDINHTRRFTNQKIPGQISLPKEKNPKTILSFDNVSICYEVQGHASPALVFVHGLGCNRTYWDKQVKYFSANHQVVTIDLPGHGDSGLNRDQWTIKAFGKDVVSVIEHLGLNSIILIGHSMGGPVIIEAASYLEKQLIGSIGVDTFHNLLMKPMTQQEVESVCERIKNYGKDSLQYILDPKLKEYIETCRESLTPEIRDEAFKDMVVYMQTMNTNFHYPFILINSSQWLPTNIHSAKKCNVEVRLMDKVGHFCMMEDSETFNTLLSNAISEFQSGKEAKKDDKLTANIFYFN
jgi:amino acid adenylation domain-containing protein